MIKQAFTQGITDAYRRFGIDSIKLAAKPGFFSRQHQAAKDLVSNVRGGFGGKWNPAVAGQGWTPPPGFNPEIAQGMHRQQAMGNLKTLLPSMGLAAGGLYAANKLLSDSPEEKAQKRQMRMNVFGAPVMV
jgi:hypothetical protein